MVEATSPSHGRHIVKKENIPGINQSVTLNKESFSRNETLTAVKVPVYSIQEFSRKVSKHIDMRVVMLIIVLATVQ